MRFLVEKINGQIVHDFSFQLKAAKEFWDWYGVEKMSIRYLNGMDFSMIRNPGLFTPVGSVDFVSGYLRRFYPEKTASLRPLNVPLELFPFAGRKIINVTKIDDLKGFFDGGVEVYRKSLDLIKHPDNGLFPVRSAEDFVGFQVAEKIDIMSEWRVFVFHHIIQHVSNYAGDTLLFPSEKTISEMVGSYADSAPVAYTLDVGVTGAGETVVIECHRFFSCGLYGFSDLKRIPIMLSQCWFEMKTYGGDK